MDQHAGQPAQPSAVVDRAPSIHGPGDADTPQPFLASDLAWPHLARLCTAAGTGRALDGRRLVIDALRWLPIGGAPISDGTAARVGGAS